MTDGYIASISTNTLWTQFQEVFQAAVNKYIPTKMSSTRFNLPWVNQPTRSTIRRKQLQGQEIWSPADWLKFKLLRRSINRGIRKAHQQYVNEVIGESDKKPFWSNIKSTSQEVFGISSVTSMGRCVSLAADKAQALNKQCL